MSNSGLRVGTPVRMVITYSETRSKNYQSVKPEATIEVTLTPDDDPIVIWNYWYEWLRQRVTERSYEDIMRLDGEKYRGN